jgi:MOSC domain-containing protein YiiM
MLSLAQLRSTFASPGRLVWIGLRPARGEPMQAVSRVRALQGRGLEGDRKAQRSGGERQVTLYQHEHLAVLASLLGCAAIEPEAMRRNLAVAGINLLALRARRFAIGSLLLEGTGYCAPCRRLEETLGRGGFNASRGHGGITASVLGDGWLAIGDEVTAEGPDGSRTADDDEPTFG